MSKETTVVEQVELDLNAILNPGADSVMIPTKDEKKPGLFTRKVEDLSFLNKPMGEVIPDPNDQKKDEKKNPELDEAGKPKVEVAPVVTSEEVDNIVNETDDQKATGRPKLDKDGLIELATKLINKKLLVPFDDGKPLTEYSLKDFEELFEANNTEKERKIREQVPAEFFQSLPPEMQYAAKYISDGGQDLKGLFRTLAAVEEVKSLNPENESDQRSIVRSYLQATNFGTPDDIEEEINGWDDRNELQAKANKFKPKLDALSEKQVQYQVQQQEALRGQQAQQAQIYMDNVYKTLEPADLNGLKLDRKTQNLLFSGLVQPNYQSVSGKQTNLLGHLLEKFQFVEPNHALVAEALWLLADPDGYRDKVREIQKKDVVTETVRKLKTEEKNKLASHVVDEEDNAGQQKKLPGIPRPSENFFKR